LHLVFYAAVFLVYSVLSSISQCVSLFFCELLECLGMS